jgi:hypothetical protein
MTETTNQRPTVPYGRWAIVLLLCTLGGWAFYHYVPISWHARLTWAIDTPVQNGSPSRDWVPTWKNAVEKQPFFSGLQQQQCSVSAFQDEVLCEFKVYQYKTLKNALAYAQDVFPWQHGWHTKEENRQAIQYQQEKLSSLVNIRTSNQEEIKALEKEIGPLKATVEKWVQERDLYEKNKNLRQQQLDLFRQLIPTMDATSDLRKLYIQQEKESQARIGEMNREISRLDQKLETRAQPWLTKLQLQEENARYAMQMTQHENKIDLLRRAQSQTIEDHIPDPMAETWLWQKTDVRAQHTPGVFFAAWISLFLLFTHIFLRQRRQF